jgi:Bacterial Ig-like domain (group 3)/FG-GAP-like repeat
MFKMFHFSAVRPCNSSPQPSGTLIIPHSKDSYQFFGLLWNKPKIIAALLVLAGFATGATAYATPSTTTTLQVTGAGGSLPSGSVVTLTATVVSVTTAVTPGTVNFCDISLNTNCTAMTAIGSAQLTTAGIASIKTQLGVGTHSLVAVFAGTTLYPASTSTASALTITGAASYPTATSLSFAAGTLPGSYNLTAAVSGMGSYATPAPTGTVNFLNTSDGNAHLASASLQATPGESTVSFGSPLPVPSSAFSSAYADINGDGKLDLVTVVTLNTTGTSVSVLLGNGDGTFQALSAFTVPTTFVGGLVIGDFNNDGKPDLVAMPANPEFLESGPISVLLGNGDGTFQPAIASSSIIGAGSTYVADVNGDGNLDIIAFTAAWAECAQCNVIVLLGNGDGTFQSPVTTEINERFNGVVIGDFNHDGKLDLVVSSSLLGSGAVYLFLGNNNGTFQSPIAITPSDGSLLPLSLAGGDFNGDGYMDLAVVVEPAASEPTYLSVYLGKDDGTFQAPVAYATPGIGVVQAHDFNGDGKIDLLYSNPLSYTISLLLGKGDGTFQPPLTPFNLPLSEYPDFVADFNGDGKVDWLTTASTSNQVLLNTGGPTATATASGISIAASGPQLVLASYLGDTANGASTSSTVSIPGSGAPITWANPAQITYGTALSATQLNATSSVQGTFVYSPAAGTVLSAGTHTLSVTFTPNNSSGYAPSTPTVSITVNQAGSATTIALSNNNTTLTATVTSLTSGSPTGNVGFYEGQTLVGTSPLVGGTASFSTTSAPVGNSIITAEYDGDANFTQSASPATQILGISPTSASLTVSQAGTVTDTIRIAPAAGTVGTIQLSCSGLPQAATCSFQPASITLGGTNTPTSVVLTIQTGTSTTASLEAPQQNKRGNLPLVFAAIFWIPGGIAAAIKPRKGKGSSRHRQLLLLALLIGLGGMTACSGSSASSSNSSTPKGTSTVQVIAAGSGSLTQTVSLTLSVQ